MRSSFLSDAKARSHFATEESLRFNFRPLINDIFDGIFVCLVALRKSGATGRSSNLDTVTFIQLLKLERVYLAGKLRSHTKNKQEFLFEKILIKSEREFATRKENETKNFSSSKFVKQFIFYLKLNHKVSQLCSHERHNSYCYTAQVLLRKLTNCFLSKERKSDEVCMETLSKALTCS